MSGDGVDVAPSLGPLIRVARKPGKGTAREVSVGKAFSGDVAVGLLVAVGADVAVGAAPSAGFAAVRVGAPVPSKLTGVLIRPF